MAQIQRSAVELKKRNTISRIFHAKKDEATIAAWRSDLDRILHIFEVRSIVRSLLTLLTPDLQTELALHTHGAVSDVREGVANTHQLVSNIREGFVNTHELVSDIHRAVVNGQKGGDIRDQAVDTHGVPFMIAESLIIT